MNASVSVDHARERDEPARRRRDRHEANRDARRARERLEPADRRFALRPIGERELDASLMPSYATRLKDAEIDDVVAYLSTLRGAK